MSVGVQQPLLLASTKAFRKNWGKVRSAKNEWLIIMEEIINAKTDMYCAATKKKKKTQLEEKCETWSLHKMQTGNFRTTLKANPSTGLHNYLFTEWISQTVSTYLDPVLTIILTESEVIIICNNDLCTIWQQKCKRQVIRSGLRVSTSINWPFISLKGRAKLYHHRVIRDHSYHYTNSAYRHVCISHDKTNTTNMVEGWEFMECEEDLLQIHSS